MDQTSSHVAEGIAASQKPKPTDQGNTGGHQRAVDRPDSQGALKTTQREAGAQGMAIAALFCPRNRRRPLRYRRWDLRTAAIKGEGGEVLFEQTDCEIPATWSQLATNVVVSKYFYGEVDTPERETSVRQLIHRVSRTIADWGIEDGYFATPEDGERFYRELAWLCLHQVRLVQFARLVQRRACITSTG